MFSIFMFREMKFCLNKGVYCRIEIVRNLISNKSCQQTATLDLYLCKEAKKKPFLIYSWNQCVGAGFGARWISHFLGTRSWSVGSDIICKILIRIEIFAYKLSFSPNNNVYLVWTLLNDVNTFFLYCVLWQDLEPYPEIVFSTPTHCLKLQHSYWSKLLYD